MKKILATLAIMGTIVASSLTVFAAPQTMPDGTIFDAEYYAQQNPDVVAAFGTDAGLLYQHYVMFGKNEGRQPYAQAANVTNTNSATMTLPDGTVFDPVYYAKNNPHVVAALGTDANLLAQHYIQFGKAEGRKPAAGNTETVTMNNNAGVTTLQGLLDYMQVQTVKEGWKVYADKGKNIGYWGKPNSSSSEYGMNYYAVALAGWPNGFGLCINYRRSDEKIINVVTNFQKTWLTYSGGHTDWHMDGRVVFSTGTTDNYGPETEWTKLSYADCQQIVDVAMSYYAGKIDENTLTEYLRSMAVKGGNVNVTYQ